MIIPYKGTCPALNDLLCVQIHTTFANILNVSPHIKSGRLRALAVSSGERSRVMPELPTIDESGLKGFDLSTWFGVFAPTAVPPATLSALHREITRALDAPDQLRPTYELWTVRREAWLPEFAMTHHPGDRPGG